MKLPRSLLYHNFFSVYRLDQWVKRRFTPLGRLLIATVVAAAVYGVNTRATLSYQLATFALALLVVGIAWAPSFRGDFRAHRRLPRHATVGQTVRYSVEIENLSSRTLRGLQLHDRVAAALPSQAEFARLVDPEDGVRNRFDRWVGYPRWASYMRDRRGATTTAGPVASLRAGERTRVELELEPVRRGLIKLVGVTLTRDDPLGIFRAELSATLPGSLLVLPRRYPVDWSELLGDVADGGAGQVSAATLGGWEEFASLREYRAGDPLRHIHWRAWARLATPVVKEFHDEFLVRQAVVLDTFTPERSDHRVFEAAVSAAASFVFAAHSGGAPLDLAILGADFSVSSRGRAGNGVETLLERLATVQPNAIVEVPDLEAAARARLGGVGACVCVLLAWDGPRRALVRALREQGVAVLVLLVGAPAPPGRELGPMRDVPQRFKTISPDSLARELDSLSRPVPAAADSRAAA